MYQISYLINHYSSKIILYRKDEHYNRTLRTLIKISVEHRTLIKKGMAPWNRSSDAILPSLESHVIAELIESTACPHPPICLEKHFFVQTTSHYSSFLPPCLYFEIIRKVRNWLILYHSPGDDNTPLLSVWFFSISPQRSVTRKQSKEKFNFESLAQAMTEEIMYFQHTLIKHVAYSRHCVKF